MKAIKLKSKRIDREVNTPLNLSNAMVCMDCEHIFNSYNPSKNCPKCGSGVSVYLSRWVPSRRVATPALEVM